MYFSYWIKEKCFLLPILRNLISQKFNFFIANLFDASCFTLMHALFLYWRSFFSYLFILFRLNLSFCGNLTIFFSIVIIWYKTIKFREKLKKIITIIIINCRNETKWSKRKKNLYEIKTPHNSLHRLNRTNLIFRCENRAHSPLKRMNWKQFRCIGMKFAHTISTTKEEMIWWKPIKRRKHETHKLMLEKARRCCEKWPFNDILEQCM